MRRHSRASPRADRGARGSRRAPHVQARARESPTTVHTRRGRAGNLAASCSSHAEPDASARRAMRPRTPQIVALGGGGFSMERDSSLLDDYVLSLTDAARPRVCFLPTASGDADHYVVRFYRRFSASCDASHVSLFRRDQGTGGVEDDLATPPARAGPDLRRRRQRRQHARRVARARARRRPAQGLAQGHRAVRPVGRLAVLVRRGAQRLPRRAAQRPRPRPAAVLQLRPLRRRAGAARRVPPLRRRRHARRASPPRTASRCTSAARASQRVVSSRPDGCAYRVEHAGDGVRRDAR